MVVSTSCPSKDITPLIGKMLPDIPRGRPSRHSCFDTSQAKCMLDSIGRTSSHSNLEAIALRAQAVGGGHAYGVQLHRRGWLRTPAQLFFRPPKAEAWRSLSAQVLLSIHSGMSACCKLAVLSGPRAALPLALGRLDTFSIMKAEMPRGPAVPVRAITR